MNKTVEIKCYCGAPARLADNSEYYGRSYGNGRCWMCTRFPECDGYVGTHPDDSPLGTLVDNETKQLRMQIHRIIDPLWQNQDRPKHKARGSVYGWLKRITGLEAYHTGSLSKEDCLLVLEKIKENPYRQPSKIERRN